MSNAFTVRVSAGRVALLGLMTAGLVASGSAVALASTAVPAAPAAPAVAGFWHHHHHHHWFGYGFAPYAGGRHFDNHHSYNHHHHHWYEHKLETWRGGDDTDNRGLDARRSSDDFGFCGCGDDRFRHDGFRDGHDGVRDHAVTPGEAPAAAPASTPAEAPAATPAEAPAATPAEAPATAPASTPAAGSTAPSK